jgi:hypothetical protein
MLSWADSWSSRQYSQKNSGAKQNRHSVFVRGRDAAGNWGPVTAVFVDVATPVELQTLSLE